MVNYGTYILEDGFKYQIGDSVGNIYDEDIGEVVAREHGEITGYPQYKVLYEYSEGDWALWYYEDALLPV